VFGKECECVALGIAFGAAFGSIRTAGGGGTGDE
jgi:hypothetical protein